MKSILTSLIILAPLSSPLQSQRAAASDSAHHHDRDTPGAVAERTSGPIQIDGVLDEAAWAAARPIAGLTQLDPLDGTPASERTEVRFL